MVGSLNVILSSLTSMVATCKIKVPDTEKLELIVTVTACTPHILKHSSTSTWYAINNNNKNNNKK